ncbi:hypothetical protein FRC17_000584 [Serendipita sp. 399]|nr:hypothetical protein FRC17_000584 [Serendipita sp. 399]
MAHLTKPTQYRIEDSNIALLGSDLEKHVREHAGDTEPAWQSAGQAVGLNVWRVEQFQIKPWKDIGQFYDGDSYIVLNTYKKDPNSEVLSYDLHFWLGEYTSQDEAGTAAYKTVELDDHLGGTPVQYREVQDYESPRFLSYFSKLLVLHGGTASGFRHVTEPPPLNLFNFYHISASKPSATGHKPPNLIVRQVMSNFRGCLSQYPADVFVLDKGREIWQYNSKKSSGKEKFKAAEFVRQIIDARKHEPVLKVFDEGGQGSGRFVTELAEEHADESEADDTDTPLPTPASSVPSSPRLFRISDDSGQISFSQVDIPSGSSPSLSNFEATDAFLLDDSTNHDVPAIYAWIGKEASHGERKYAVQYAQQYLWQLQPESKSKSGRAAHKLSSTSVVRLAQGHESSHFLRAVGAQAAHA